jgi:hypothetical protein
MTTVELAISDEDHRILQRRASEKGFTSVSEYLIDLARKDRHDAAREHLKQLIEEGLASPSFEVDDEWWERKKRELTERIKGMPE